MQWRGQVHAACAMDSCELILRSRLVAGSLPFAVVIFLRGFGVQHASDGLTLAEFVT